MELFLVELFYKTHGIYSYNQWNYFQRGCMDKWRSDDFLIQTWCIPLEANPPLKPVYIELSFVGVYSVQPITCSADFKFKLYDEVIAIL